MAGLRYGNTGVQELHDKLVEQGVRVIESWSGTSSQSKGEQVDMYYWRFEHKLKMAETGALVRSLPDNKYDLFVESLGHDADQDVHYLLTNE